jgi:hypothetical protein
MEWSIGARIIAQKDSIRSGSAGWLEVERLSMTVANILLMVVMLDFEMVVLLIHTPDSRAVWEMSLVMDWKESRDFNHSLAGSVVVRSLHCMGRGDRGDWSRMMVGDDGRM